MPAKRKAWIVTLAAYLAGVAVALNQAKVPPVMQVLIEKLHVGLATGGWLMSAFAVAGVILGIPAAFVLAKVGPKWSGLIALGFTMLGSAIGALATSAALMLFGRVVEGVGLGLIAVIAPTVISTWFPPQERGTPMGLWASWVPVGSFAIYNLAGPLLDRFGWQGLWWFGTLVALVAFIIYAAVVEAPEKAAATGDAPASFSGSFSLLLNPASWVLALVFGAFNFALNGYGAWAPSYLSQGLGLQSDAANFSASLSSLAVIPSTIVAGWLLDRVQNRRRVLSAALLVTGILLIWSFQLGPASVVPYMLVLGAVVGFIPTTIFTLAPESFPRPQAGLALGLVSISQNIGLLFGPPIVGAIIGGGNWAMGAAPLVALIAVGLAASLLLRPKRSAILVTAEAAQPV